MSTTTEPHCENCKWMRYRNDRDGEAHRHCEAHGNWIPDEEMFPVCGWHEYRAMKNRSLIN